jgi:hypothetical protein
VHYNGISRDFFSSFLLCREENKRLRSEMKSLSSDKSSTEIRVICQENECKSTRSLLHAALEKEKMLQAQSIAAKICKAKNTKSEQSIDANITSKSIIQPSQAKSVHFTLKGLEEKEAAVIQDLFFLF